MSHWCIIALVPALWLLLLTGPPKCECGVTNAKLEELCGPKGFYCRINSTCVSRRLRCPSKNTRHWRKAFSLCPAQENCQPMTFRFGVSSPLIFRPKRPALPNFGGRALGNRFFILTAFSPIYRTGSRSRRRRKRGVVEDVWRTLIKDPWMHSFVQYKGFVYEFGSYGVRELDVNDPNYKYNREWSTGWSRIGTSTCQYRDVKRFLKEWKTKRSKYSWYSNNCHSFTKALVEYLKHDCRDSAGALVG